MTLRVQIDAERCEGHGRCYNLAAELFEPDEIGDGAVLGDGTVPVGLEHKAHLAAANCPELAITVLSDADAEDGA
jgi:ferredoxin